MRLSTIRSLYGGAGPWASVYLDATGTRETGTPQEARRQLELRWRAARESLRRDGADEATLHAIDGAIGSAPSVVGPAEVAVLASHGTVALTSTLPVAPIRQKASWSAQPHVADLLRAHGGGEIRWVRADVDRTGGSVTTDDGTTTTVRGEDQYISKIADEARDRIWSTGRDQRAAEENWHHNSHDLARALVEAVERIRADVVVLSGDVRSRANVLESLPEPIAARVVQVEHEVEVRPHPESRLHARREPEVFDALLVEATREAVNAEAARRRSETAERFYSGLSSGDSVRGLGPVCQAAREMRIDTLVLSAEPAHRMAWVDPANPTMVGEAKRDTGTELAIQEPADDTLVGAAAFAGAESLIIEADRELVDGLGAILRFQP